MYPTTADNYFAPNTGYNAPNSTCFGGGKAMVSHLFYYQLAVLALAWLFVLLHVTESKPGLPALPMPAKRKRQRSSAPKPFAGLTHRPPCALCERETVHPNPSTPVPPAPKPPTHHRPRTVYTSASIMASATPFCFCMTQKHLTVKRAMNSRA